MFYSKKLLKFKNLKHCFFSRKNGFSKNYFSSLNCGLGSSDKKENILKNLKFVSDKIGCDERFLITVNQTHSNKTVFFENIEAIKNKLPGDAIVTKMKNVGISILTADCAPILLYDPQEKIIGCIHSGWKGALNGVIKNTIIKFKELNSDINNITAVIGPCIKKESYDVKIDFYNKFLDADSGYKIFFEKVNSNKFFFDLRAFINYEISKFNIGSIENIEMDTFSEPENFFSYRRSCFYKEADYGRCISVILMT